MHHQEGSLCLTKSNVQVTTSSQGQETPLLNSYLRKLLIRYTGTGPALYNFQDLQE